MQGGVFPVRRGARDEEAFITAETILDARRRRRDVPRGRALAHRRPRRAARPGIGRLVLDSGAPVVPIAIHGSSKIRNWKRLRFPRVRVQFGEPMRFERRADAPRERHQEIADAIFAEIRALYARAERRERAAGGRRARQATTVTAWRRPPVAARRSCPAERRPRRDATSRPPTGSCARPRRAARGSCCCRRSGRCSASGEELRAGAEPIDGPAMTLGARLRAELGIELRRRLVHRAAREDGAVHNTSLHISPRRRDPRQLPQDPHVRRRPSTGSSTASPTRDAGRGDRRLAHRRRRRAGDDASATTSASPSSTGSSRCAARACCSCRRRSRWRRRATTGRRCCARGRSRTRRS